MTDFSKRANRHGLREVRGLLTADPEAPSGAVGVDWSDMVSLRAEDTTDENFWRFFGEASIVEHTYVVHDMFGEFNETIATGAFDKTLAENPAVMLNYMHNPETTMVTTARAASHPDGGLSLFADPNLRVEARIPKTDPDAQRVMPKVARGDASSMSFAFRVTRQEWNEDYTDRRILEVNLNRGDVASIVTGLGANPPAWGDVRSLAEAAERLGHVLDPAGVPAPLDLAQVRHDELRDLIARRRPPVLL